MNKFCLFNKTHFEAIYKMCIINGQKIGRENILLDSKYIG